MNTLVENQSFIQNLKIEDVPWHRLTTPYGRASDFPEYLHTIQDMADLEEVKTALDEIFTNIEHQETFWHATPFAMIFLARILEKAVSEMDTNQTADYITEQLLVFFGWMMECYHEQLEQMGGTKLEPLARFSEMLDEKYLWSEEYSEEEDEKRYSEGDFFPDELFYSLYYYSYQTLLYCKPVLNQLEHTHFSGSAKALQELL